MAYQQNIPAATDVKSQSQSDIQGNFQAIKTLIDVNHVTFGAANQGKHNVVTIPLAISSPVAPTFLATEEGLYNLVNATTGKNELYVHRQTVDAPTDVPFTASKLSNTAIASCGNGWSYLPSGLLIKWGGVACATSPVSITPTVTSGGPNFTKVLSINVTPTDTGTAVDFNSGQRTNAVATPGITNGNFTIYCRNPSSTTGIRYFVIGV